MHKYVSAGLAKVPAEGLKLLLDSMHSKIKVIGLQEWREDNLWTLGINDILVAN